MTVQEFIERLKRLPPKAQVKIIVIDAYGVREVLEDPIVEEHFNDKYPDGVVTIDS